MTALGFQTRFARTQTGGSIKDNTGTWGIRIDNTGSEIVTLSSSQATPSLYIVGTSGSLGKQQGKLVKLSDITGTPDSVFSTDLKPESGTSAAKATAIDSNGNVYVVGHASGSFGNQLNQAARDAFLTKYDSAGQLQWTRLLGSAEDAAGFAVGIDVNGGIVVTGSVTGKLAPGSVGGSSDTFVAKYDGSGTRKWLRHIAPVASDHATSLLTDSAGNVYVGGQLSGTIATGQTSAGGVDAFITKLSSGGGLLYHRQFGSTGSDSIAGMGFGTDGRLIVASVQNGRATLTKFDTANGTSAAKWQFDIGDLQGGALSGLAMSGNGIYISGTTSNAALTAGGQASIARASSGGSEAFVFKLTDRPQGNGGQAPRPDFISYVGTSGFEQGGTLTVSAGKVYLTGTTTGTFAGQTRTIQGTHNMFVAQIDGNSGALGWARQYGGLEAQSKGVALAVDTQGASVLDALGLRRGKIDISQSGALEAQTTARVGDYFTMRITDLSGTRTAKIAIGIGDTLRTLATRINAHLLQAGKASVAYSDGGQRLKIEANPGTRIELIAAPKELNALAGLGIDEQLLVKDKKDETEKATAAAAEDGPHIVGLALTGKLDVLTKTSAAHAHSVLLGAMALVKQAYARLNPPAAGASALAPLSPVFQRQVGQYQAALMMLNG